MEEGSEAEMAKSKQFAPKKIGNSDMIGARGVNLIERRILEMGFLWYPSGVWKRA
jgi:hypothetical protein